MAKRGTVARNRDYILTELANGKLVTELAKELGITKQAISFSLAHSTAYKLARHEGARQRILDLAREQQSPEIALKRRWAIMRYVSDFGPDRAAWIYDMPNLLIDKNNSQREPE